MNIKIEATVSNNNKIEQLFCKVLSSTITMMVNEAFEKNIVSNEEISCSYEDNITYRILSNENLDIFTKDTNEDEIFDMIENIVDGIFDFRDLNVEVEDIKENFMSITDDFSEKDKDDINNFFDILKGLVQ